MDSIRTFYDRHRKVINLVLLLAVAVIMIVPSQAKSENTVAMNMAGVEASPQSSTRQP